MPNDDTIRKLELCEVPLCVECRFCGNKRLMEPDALKAPKMVHAYSHLAYVACHLKCSICGAKEPYFMIPLTRQEAERWLGGV